MGKFMTMNRNIAVEPFVFNHDQKPATTSRFLVTDKLGGDIVTSKVVFATDDGTFSEGDLVYVSAEIARNIHLKKFKIGDKEVSLIPYNHIVAVLKL